jgi:carbamoyl-phosphate synthase large subunit
VTLPVVLVTGVGDTVGQALVKAARMSSHRPRLVGTDVDPRAAGLAWVDARALLPRSSDERSYIEALVYTCEKERVQLVLPGSEPELLVLADNAAEIRSRTGTAVVAGPPPILRTALDKWETCRFLESEGLAFPRYARAERRHEVDELVAQVGFPLLAKPRRSSGSRGVQIVNTLADLRRVAKLPVATVVQELLGDETEEYSVESWTCQDGRLVGPISYRREQLSAGDTYSAVVSSHPDVEAEGLSVAASLRSTGPCNVQLRITSRGPVTFEINPRFSGGVSMRAHFGFNEIDLALSELVLGQDPEPPQLRSGLVRRFWEEQYQDESDIEPAHAARVS